jgi:KUP system potassium uptake protein
VAHRVDTLAGFYAVAQYRGFRDGPQLRIDEIVTKIIEIESRPEPDGAQREQIVAQLRDLSRRPTHVYGIPRFRVAVICAEQCKCSFPHYLVKSKRLELGRITPVVNFVRRVLIEGIYGRLGMVFYTRNAWIGY